MANQKENKETKTKKKKTTLVKFNDQVQTKFIEDESMDQQSDYDEEDFNSEEEEFDDEIDDDEEEEENDDDNDNDEELPSAKEDIYGRMIDAKGNVVKHNSCKSTIY